MKKVLFLCAAALMISVPLFATGSQDSGSGTSEDGVVWLEWWNDSYELPEMGKDHFQAQDLAENFGISFTSPQGTWNGGAQYIQDLQLRIVSGDMPDIFLPWNGIEYDLANQGAIADLTDLLPEYAPNIWNSVPDEVWDMVRANSPDGRIYYIPQVWDDLANMGMIRKDWLDRVGMDVPATIDEFEAVLQAFKDQDANGNGDPNDEFPVSGREALRWWDHMWAPFGVAMIEGYPEWDMYDGQLTYSAVTPNMKAAVAWIRGLYEKGLIDPEIMVNSKKRWMAKITSDQVGSFFYNALWLRDNITDAKQINEDFELVYLPALKAPGYEGFYSARTYRNPIFCVANKSEEQIINSLKLIEYVNSPEYIDHCARGFEGYNIEVVDGERKFTAPDLNRRAPYFGTFMESPEINITKYFKYIDDPTTRYLTDQLSQILLDSSSKPVAGQILPVSIYEGYPDIQSHKLYQEYVTKIILGVLPLDAFDEFVETWYKQGGQVVTDRAREFQANFGR
ncbi:MAG: extracellular solute-binding protein [Spirochaetales bacterium]|nr:extracellular solute-binding protein [Spirochaetales bacterium]